MKKRSLFQSWFFTVLFFLAFNIHLTAQTPVDEPRLEPDSQAYYFAENFDPSEWLSQVELANWAGGVSNSEASADSLDSAVRELSEKTALMKPRQKGEAVLEFMHEHFLESYQEKQSSLDVLLKTGRYNCLSSAVLYSILGTAVGLEVSGVNTIDHAFCSVEIDDEQIDVETTNPYGFDPGTKMEFQNAFGKTTGFAYVPPGNYRDRTAIDKLKLFALLLQNRIADAEAAGRWAEAVGPAVDRWILLGGGSGAGFDDLIVRMLNYGTMLSRAGLEEDALAWAERGIAAYGPHPEWVEFVDGIANNLLLKLIRRNRLDDARMRLEMLRPRLSPQAAFELDVMVSDSELVAALDAVKAGGPDPDFLEVLNRIKRGGVIEPERTREFEVAWRLYSISLIAETDGWRAAWEASEQALLELGTGAQLENARRIYRSNHRADLYNAAVDAYNSRRFEDARSLIENAMLEFPDESIFRQLLSETERALSGD